MKKILLLALIGLLVSCTNSKQAHLLISCPCIVKSVEVSIDGSYNVTFYSTDPNNTHAYFSFYTDYKYNLGDTIK